ncbi:MAG TPA: copper-binding protein, partial [Bacteroidia bacterium]|nr:copper-binding protein [Bacteroidia bacterium]
MRTFPVRGVVQKRMDDPAMMLIDHEEIPGFMPRMVMPFRVLDAAEFDGIAPGMVVTLNYHVTESESWATDVVATGERGELTLRQETPSAKRLGVGDVLPDHGF